LEGSNENNVTIPLLDVTMLILLICLIDISINQGRDHLFIPMNLWTDIFLQFRCYSLYGSFFTA